MKTKSLEELKKSYEERLAALKKEKEEALKKAKARENKKTAAETERLRKQDAHIKILIGGFYLAEIKSKKDKAQLDKIAVTLKSEKDKKLLKDLAGIL
jgi:hypothetical protein